VFTCLLLCVALLAHTPLCTSAHIPYLWHKGRDFIQTDFKGNETKVGNGCNLADAPTNTWY